MLDHDGSKLSKLAKERSVKICPSTWMLPLKIHAAERETRVEMQLMCT